MSYAAAFPMYFLSIWDRKADSRTIAATMNSFCLHTLFTQSLNTTSRNFALVCNAPCHLCLFYCSLVQNLSIRFAAIYNPWGLRTFCFLHFENAQEKTLMKISVDKNYVMTLNVKHVLFPYYLPVLLSLMLGHEGK
jgi:hypothetical protein